MSAISVCSRTRIITVLIGVLGLVVGGSAVALSAGPSTTVGTGAPNVTKYVYPSDGNPADITSTSFVDVPGATTAITVPAGTKAVIDAGFSATSICVGTPVIPNASCSVRILIAGVEGQPNVFEGFDVGYQAHMIERLRGPLGPGSNTVKVQSFVPCSGAELALIDWLLVAERVKA